MANLNSDHMRSELGLKCIQTSSCQILKNFNVGDFNPSTYQHVLPEGAHEFDDYDSEYEEQHPKLGFTDEQVEAEVAKLDPEDKKFYEGVPRIPGYLLLPAWQDHRNAGSDKTDHDGPVP